MVTDAEYTIPLEDFLFGQTGADFSDHDVEIECVKCTDDSVRVYFWISPSPTHLLEDAEQSEFESLTHLDTVGDEYLFRTDWPTSRESVLKGICRTDAVVESATLESQGWSIRLRTESSEQLSEFSKYCHEQGFDANLTQFPPLVQLYNSRDFKLTEKQHEALTLAYSEGYFEKPRETTLEELGEKLDVTPQRVLQLIQDGQKNILEHTVVRSVNTPF